MEESYSFGTWLRQRRRVLNLTQAELARQVGCATVTLQKIELDERRPSLEIAERLAGILHIPAEERAAFLKSARGELAVDQLTSSSAPQPAPPWRPAPRPMHNLPIPLTPLIGREREIAAVSALLQEHAIRLVTLTGPGGTGKTRLAIAVAERLVEAFPDGVTFVQLEAIADPALVIPTIAQALGISATGDLPLRETLRSVLQALRTLLVLDNFEQVLPAAVDVASLLATAPTLKVLVTSRAALRLSGEQECPVVPLALPDPQHLPELDGLSHYEAVALFIACTRAVKPDFQVTNANAPAVAEICARLDGLPLAIELAAARTRLFAPQALLARLSHRLQFLTGGARNMPARQQTIRDTIAWSYDLLPPPHQTLFRHLAVFVGGWTLQAAESVCAAEDDPGVEMLDGLTLLVEQSLVRQETGPDGEPRFRRLQTIREYALEQLAASGEETRLRDRHLAYYRDLAEAAAPVLRGGDQRGWLDRLDLEHDNLRAALTWCLLRGAREDGLRLGSALLVFWHLHGHYQEGDAWLTRLLADRSGSSPATQGRALVAAGRIAGLVSDGPRSRALYEEATVLSREAGDHWTYAWAVFNLANDGHFSPEAALAAAHAAGDPWLVAEAQLAVATALYDQGQPDQAREIYEASLRTYRTLDDANGTYYVLYCLALIVHDRKLYAEAEAYAEEALTEIARVAHSPGIATCQYLLGRLAQSRGDHGRAAALLGDAVEGFRKAGIPKFLAWALVRRGMEALALDDVAQATTWLDESLALLRAPGEMSGVSDMGRRWGVSFVLHNQARVARAHGQLDQAIALLQEAVLQASACDEPVFERLAALAGVLTDQEAPERAARLFGAVEAQRAETARVIEPSFQPEYERDLATTRARLDAEVFAAAWAEGQAMTVEQAIAYALDEVRDG